LEVKESATIRCYVGENGNMIAAVLLARRLKAANPDAKHPGKAEKIPGRKACFPSG
jgi:hypothetical protein